MMQNSPILPALAVGAAVLLALLTVLMVGNRVGGIPDVLTEIEIGVAATAFTLLIFGFQGLISVLLEGRQLHIGRVPPRLTNPLSLAIVGFSVVLLAISVALGTGLVNEWESWLIGLLAGAGCVVLAGLLIFYKEAFVGDEARLDERDDGVPW